MTTRLQPVSCASSPMMGPSAGVSPLAGTRSSLLVPVARAVGMFTLLQAWNERARQRRRLGQLDDRLLNDIGVSRAAAAHETAKRPWED